MKNPGKAKMIIAEAKKLKGSGVLSKVGNITKALVGVIGMALFNYLKNHPELIIDAAKAVSKYMSGGDHGGGHGSGYGSGLAIAGQDGGRLPLKLMKFIEAQPALAKKIGLLAKKGKGYQSGSGTISKLVAAAGLIGTTAAGTAYALYNYALENPAFTAKLAAKGVKLALTGSGVSLAGGKHDMYGKKYRRKKGKIIGTKAQVYCPNMPHGITSGGLYKDDLMKGKGKKIISKKRHELGLKMYKMNIGKLTPFRPRQN